MARTLGRVSRLVPALMTVASGFYLAYYLFRWEWVRAQIAGTVFVAALIITATVLILARLDRLERRLAGRAVARAEEPAISSGRDAPPDQSKSDGAEPADTNEPRPTFPWLSELTDLSRTHVFIPVLFAAGLVVSIVANVVERISTALHRGATPLPRRPRSARLGWVTATGMAVGVAALTALAVLGIHEVSHYDPTTLGPGTTELTVDVEVQGRPLEPAATVEMMANYCTVETGTGIELDRVEQIGPHTALLVVTPLLDEQMSRRYGGCLQDAVLERHWLHVTGIRLVPATGRGPAFPPLDQEDSA